MSNASLGGQRHSGEATDSPRSSSVGERTIDDFPQTELRYKNNLEYEIQNVTNHCCRRDLKERHVNMMAFSTLIGIGLFLQSGKVCCLLLLNSITMLRHVFSF